MELRRLGATALALATALLLIATAMDSADAQKKKKPVKPSPAKVKPVDNKALIAEGKKVYAKNSCGACHKIAATGGATGPDLTTVGKKETPKELVVYIRDPKKKNPQSLMPAYGPSQIDDKALKALVAYLRSLK
jgi:mono/diheme cytochrome c family protein